MTEQELDRLADLIARALLDSQGRASSAGPRETATPSAPSGASWLPNPVRPEPPARGGEPPVWSGAAQDLSDVAPGGATVGSGSRASTAEMTRLTRAAAAGRGGPVETTGRTGRAVTGFRARPRGAGAIDVPIGVSNRHIHLSPEHFRALFGGGEPTVERVITQPGQFAAKQTVDVAGPRGKIERIRVVGPARGQTQLEIAFSDAHRLGVTPPVLASGALGESSGGVTLSGPAGSVKLERGVIIAARHLHLGPEDAKRCGLHDGDRLDVRCGTGPRAATLHDVLVRSGPAHATELHLDLDEALAVGVKTGDRASIIAWRTAGSRRRVLVTERDVVAMARRGAALPPDALLTPSARDRARALGLLSP